MGKVDDTLTVKLCY